VELSDQIEIKNCLQGIKDKKLKVYNKTKDRYFETVLEISDDEVEVILSGGQLRHIKKQIVTN
jgi:aconitate hydratase